MNRREWADLVASKVLVLDGGLATLLLSQKVPGPGFCPEAFLLEALDDVVAVHARYARSGADILLTNTFGGNRVRLQAAGLAGSLERVNRLGVEAARRAAGSRCLVAGDIGPTGLYCKGRKRPPSGKIRGIFREQAEALLKEGPDLMVLETMMTFAGNAKTALGFEAAICRDACLAAGADMVGANCSRGAASVLTALEALADGFAGALAAEPNAGLPRWRKGERRYEEGPAVLARFVPRFLRAGARLVGGCCGTTPAHIAALRRALL